MGIRDLGKAQGGGDGVVMIMAENLMDNDANR